MGATAGAAFPRAFVDGVAHFNAGAFYEAHETFEELLDAVEDDRRWDLLLALIQVAVAYHKGSAGYAGCERMLRLGDEKLRGFGAVAFGVDVAGLRTRIAADLAACEAGAEMKVRLAADPPRLRLLGARSG